MKKYKLVEKQCARCGVEMECHYNRIYCPTCAKVQKEIRKAQYRAEMKGIEKPKARAAAAPSMSIEQVAAAARKCGMSYGKYVVGLERKA